MSKTTRTTKRKTTDEETVDLTGAPPGYDIGNLTFEQIKDARGPALRAVCQANSVNAVGTDVDLRQRLRQFKIGRAARTDEKLCPDCGGSGRPAAGPRTIGHTVVRSFLCDKCRNAFSKGQDTRSGTLQVHKATDPPEKSKIVTP